MTQKTSSLSSASSYSIWDFCPDSKTIGHSLHSWGLTLATPYYWSTESAIRAFVTPLHPDEFDNCDYKVVEVARRFFTVALLLALAPVTGVLALSGALIESIGDCLAQEPYRYLKGEAEEIQPGEELRILTLNGCMFPGGFPTAFGGVSTASKRVDKLARLIEENKPHVILLQEISFGPSLDLYSKLKKQFAHFYTRIGPNPGRLESCLFVGCNYPVVSEPLFVPFPDHFGMKRGFFCLETPMFWILTTHMEPGDDELSRTKQLAQITEKIKELSAKKPCFLLGDFNIPRTGSENDEYSRSLIPKEYVDAHAKKFPELNETSATCTTALDAYMRGNKPPKNHLELIDFALLDKASQDSFELNMQLLDTFSLDKPGEALSDHRALLLQAKPRIGGEKKEGGSC